MHVDPELLGLLALGEHAGSPDEHAHLAGCADCARELAELRRVVDLGRAAGPEPLTVPGAAVWARIRDDLAATPAHRADYVGHAALTPADAAFAAASGTAELATDALGRRVLQLALQANLPTTGLRQAWLVHRADPEQRQAIGILDGLHGVWTIDHSIDLDDWAVLEVSQQDRGENAYSGRSIVRGELNPAR